MSREDLKWQSLFALLIFSILTVPCESRASAEPSSPQSPSKTSPWHFIVGLGYHMADQTQFRSVSTNISSTTYEATYISNPAIEVSVEAMYSPIQNWGGFVALTYQSERELTRVETSTGTTTEFTNGKPGIQVALLEAGTLYRWQNLYLPIGFNYALVSFKDADNATNTKTTVNGAVGAQTGAGYFLNEHLIVEALIKVVALTAQAQGTLLTLSYGTGYTIGPALQIKYAF